MNNSDEKQYQSIVLGALLHDIGKFMQRAELEKDFNEIKDNYGKFCPLSKSGNNHTHLHAAHTAYFIEHILPDNFDKPELYNAARHHINPDEENYKKVRLHSIFDIIELQYLVRNEEKFNSRWYYKFTPLDTQNKEEIFPDIKENLDREMPEPNYVQYYRKLWYQFRGELDEIKDIQNFQRYFNELYYLLEKYTWCIPSATNAFPDISLFDHLRTTASIAGALHYHKKEKMDETSEFILYSGDISGIQDYIFKVSQAQQVGGIAKRLRGRSFFIIMLCEVIARYIVQKLGYTRTNINFCGGGNFELLLANTKSTKDFLISFERDVNGWLLEQFHGELGLVTSYTEISSKELKEDYGKCKEKLDELLSEKKLSKFNTLIGDNNFWVEKGPEDRQIRICRSCNLKLVRKEKEDSICNLCELDKKVGEVLPKSKYIRFRYEEDFGKDSLSFGKFGTVDLMEDINDISNVVIYSISPSSNKVKAKYPLAKTLPLATEQIDDLDTEKDETGNRRVCPDQTLSFSTLADMAEGDKRIGILKMDVDNLGIVFSMGLDVPPTGKEEAKDLRSISRISTLSRNLSHFFTDIVDELCKDVFKEWKQNSDWKYKEKISNIFYMVFSGGDDLLVIGPWDQIIELARKIRKEFKRFTCHNPNITISGGIYICKPKYPVSLAAKKAEEALEQSKAKGRNRITVMGETTVWDEEDKLSRVYQKEFRETYSGFIDAELREDKIFYKGESKKKTVKTLTFEELTRFSENLYKVYKSKKISRQFIYRLLEAQEIFFKSDYNDRLHNVEEDHNLMFIPYLIYNIERNVEKDEKAKMKRLLLTEGNAKKYVRQAKIPCKFILMRTR